MNLSRRVCAWTGALACALLAGSCRTSTAPTPAEPTSWPAPPTVSAEPRNAFVLLSGGGTPLSNQYSQYLQAKGLTAFFARAYPNQPAWIFFGVGNRPDRPPELADAHRVVVRDGLQLDTWEAGVLPGNRPATRASFLRALREEILPTVRAGGTLYLFIGDHGELTKSDPGESAVTLWQLKRGSRRGGTWHTDESEVLSVTELREVLARGLGLGRVVFCMTQCYSGGFHYLGLPREMTAPRTWFTSAPGWRRAPRPAAVAPLRVAGFTATDEASIAAGCTADPDPLRWVGYERFAPESLIGVDLMTERLLGAPRPSLAAAHEAATLDDFTIDKPRATSEHYLERWAGIIETKLAPELRLTDRVREAVAAFQRAVDTGALAPATGELAAKQEQVRRYLERMAAQNTSARELLLRGTRSQLEAASRAGRSRGARSGAHRRTAMAEARRAWSDTLRPAWQAALREPGAGLPGGHALEFEQRLLGEEEGGRDFLLPRGSDEDALLDEVYWQSTYAEPQRFDPPRAEAVTRWAAERPARVVAWGQASADPGLRAAAEKIAAALTMRAGEPSAARAPATGAISRRTAAERALFYRRVLAAWEFLAAVDAQPELARLAELIAIERTPLPAPAAVTPAES